MFEKKVMKVRVLFFSDDEENNCFMMFSNCSSLFADMHSDSRKTSRIAKSKSDWDRILLLTGIFMIDVSVVYSYILSKGNNLIHRSDW